jgi:hypothetical protein
MMDDRFRRSFASIEVNDTFTEAVVAMSDGSRLCFRHRVGERTAGAVGREGGDEAAGVAGELLRALSTFRLNAKHLEVQFSDGSRWEAAF